MRLLLSDAQFDLEGAERDIADGWDEYRISGIRDSRSAAEQQRLSQRKRLRRAEKALAEARIHRADVRSALLLDEENDGLP